MKPLASIVPLIATLSMANVSASTLALYNFTTATFVNPNASSPNVAPAIAGVTANAFSTVNGVSGGFSISTGTGTAYQNVSATSSKATLDEAVSAGAYFAFSINLADAFDLDAFSMDLGANTNTTWTGQVRLRASINGGGFVTLADFSQNFSSGLTGPSYGYVNQMYTFTGTAFDNLDDATVNFRLYLADSSNASSNALRIDNVTLTGTAVPEPGAALLGGIGMIVLLRRRRRD